MQTSLLSVVIILSECFIKDTSQFPLTKNDFSVPGAVFCAGSVHSSLSFFQSFSKRLIWSFMFTFPVHRQDFAFPVQLCNICSSNLRPQAQFVCCFTSSIIHLCANFTLTCNLWAVSTPLSVVCCFHLCYFSSAQAMCKRHCSVVTYCLLITAYTT